MCTLGFKQPGHSRGSWPNYWDCAEPSGTELSASQQVYQIPTMQLNRPRLKHNLKREPVFLMVMRKCFVGVAWFNARFIHSVTELLGTDYKLALCTMGGFLVSNFICVFVLILLITKVWNVLIRLTFSPAHFCTSYYMNTFVASYTDKYLGGNQSHPHSHTHHPWESSVTHSCANSLFKQWASTSESSTSILFFVKFFFFLSYSLFSSFSDRAERGIAGAGLI